MIMLNTLKYILYIEGFQGLTTLKESLKYTKNIICVVPQGFSNEQIINLCALHKLKIMTRARNESIDVGKYNCDILISSQFRLRFLKRI